MSKKKQCNRQSDIDSSFYNESLGVLHALVVKCLTRNPGVMGSSHTRSSGFFRASVLGQDTLEPQPSTVETQKRLNNVSCHCDMTGILLKMALNTIQSINNEGL